MVGAEVLWRQEAETDHLPEIVHGFSRQPTERRGSGQNVAKVGKNSRQFVLCGERREGKKIRGGETGRHGKEDRRSDEWRVPLSALRWMIMDR